MPDRPSEPAADLTVLAGELVDRLWNHGDDSVADRLLAPGFTGHSPDQPGVLDRNGLLRLVHRLRAGLPDLGLTVHAAVEQGQQVFLRTSVTGTHRGWLWGLPPTGLFTRATEMLWLRFDDGRVAELWRQSSPLRVLGQLGVLPPADAGVLGRGGHLVRTAGRLAALSAKTSAAGRRRS